jgi:hypothetical protein
MVKMRTIITFGLLQGFLFAGVAQNAPWREGETPIPARADLDVRWEAPTRAIPSNVWIYRLLPNKFSPEVISNIMNLCSFTEQNKTQETTNGVVFRMPDGSRTLEISFPLGRIHYETVEPHYGPTNLAEGVPPISEMPKLAAEFLRKTGINLSDITNSFDNGRDIQSASKFHFSEPLRIYYVGNIDITNVEYRTASFWRCVDGISLIAGDGSQISFGEHGTIRSFSITWRKLRRYQRLRSITPETAIAYLREGKAVQELVPGEVDWAAVRKVTIKKALPYYDSGQSDWLYPFLALVASTEPAFGHTQFGIDCSILDETKVTRPLAGKHDGQ